MDVSPSNSGIVKLGGAVPSSYPGIFTFQTDVLVQIEAVPASGYTFKEWRGDLNSTNNPITILIDCNKNITANFSPIKHVLNIQIEGGGSTDPPVGNHSYADGTVVIINAVPEKGWRFHKWTGDVTEPNKAVTTVNIDSDKSVKAIFYRNMLTWWFTGIIIVAVVIGAVTYLTLRSRIINFKKYLPYN